jgi:hypothetical protein
MNCAWNYEEDGLIDSVWTWVGFVDEGSYGENIVMKTAFEMGQISTYTDIGWDFVDEVANGTEDIWSIVDSLNYGLPFIVGLGRPGGQEYPQEEPEEDIIEYTNRLSIYPNPFNPETNFHFELEASSNVCVTIFNIRGQKVKTLVNDFYESGIYSIPWKADEVASGIYLVRYNTDFGKEVRKITLLK